MPFDLGDASGVVTGVLVYGGIILAALWLTMVVWTFRDMRSRSRDLIAQVLAALMVAVLTIPGLIIYLFLRPRETLAEAYERSLEEEALLQSIEEKPICPGCKARVDMEWQACPYCHTRLKKPCVRCGKMLDLAWDLCPYCTTPNTVYAADRPVTMATVTASGHARQAAPVMENGTPAEQPRRRARARGERATPAESIQFIDSDDTGI